MTAISRPNSGYAHASYADSLSEFGIPRELRHSKGWILERRIPNTIYRDAMGCYPLFTCRDWVLLEADLKELQKDLVTLTLIPAPFDNYDQTLLGTYFDYVVHYKDHFIADLTLPIEAIVKRSHRKTARRASKVIDVHLCHFPLDHLDRWVELFSHLAHRHDIKGLRAFSRSSFAKQLNIPGLFMFEAVAGKVTVGLDLWYLQNDVAYGHLAAFSDLGYRLRASYATKWHLLNFFSDKACWVDFGGTPGFQGNTNGLAKFKEGWSTGTLPVYLCGCIFKPKIYHQLAAARQSLEASYFPAYRDGEFT